MTEPIVFAGKVSITYTINGKQEIASYNESDVRLLCGNDWDEWCILEQTSFDPERYMTVEEHNEAWDTYVAAIKPLLDYAHNKLKEHK
jgi:hypothetical protein